MTDYDEYKNWMKPLWPFSHTDKTTWPYLDVKTAYKKNKKGKIILDENGEPIKEYLGVVINPDFAYKEVAKRLKLEGYTNAG